MPLTGGGPAGPVAAFSEDDGFEVAAVFPEDAGAA
jgi:hypothetical protein